MYVVLDVETTGLRPGRHELTEIYAKRIDGKGKPINSFHSIINPGRKIPSFITRLTGIDDDMVKDAPKANEAIKKFSDFIREEDVLVGHNIRFDLSFLNHAREKALGETFFNKTLCTLLLSRRVFAQKPLHSYKLGKLAEHLGLNTQGAHRAQKDVEMTIALQLYLMSQLEECKVDKINKVIEVQKWPLAKATKKLQRLEE